MTVLIAGIAFLVGIALGFAVKSWASPKRRATGTIIVSEGNEKTRYVLELDGDVDEALASKNEVLFRVSR